MIKDKEGIKMKLYKVLIAIVAGVSLSLVTAYNADASRPNYAYTLTRTKQHTVKLTNTGRTENMYRVTVKRGNKATWYYMALNAVSHGWLNSLASIVLLFGVYLKRMRSATLIRATILHR